MSLGALDFGAPPGGTLAFGTGGTSGPTPADLGIDAGLGEFTADLALGSGFAFSIDAGLGEFECDIEATFYVTVSRPGARHGVRAHWQDGKPVTATASTRWQDSAPVLRPVATRWQDGAPAKSAAAVHWQDNAAVRFARTTRWQDASPLRAAIAQRWQETERFRRALAARWQDASAVRHATAVHWQEMQRLRRTVAARWQDAAAVRRLHLEAAYDATPARHFRRTHWQDARKPPPGRSWHTIPPEPPHLCYDPADLGKLQFGLDTSALGVLAFWCKADQPPAATIVVPILRSYIVINSVGITRVNGGEHIPAVAGSFTMELDHQSWTWSFSFTTLDLVRPLLAPGSDGLPVELQAMVNGVPYRMRVEQLRRSVRHPRAMLQVQGRSNSALLDAPYAAVRTFSQPAAITAQQLMLDVLTVNGVSNGWALEWQLTDWPIPANTWAHQGTWISAINDIAGSVGGYVQPHDTADLLRILPTWPVRAWELATATPDIELPAGIATVEDTEWPVKPGYNGIFLRGEPGVATYFRNRAGTLGDVLKPMAVHPLLVHADAARQRAVAELSDSGAQVSHSLELMVLPATGLIKPGKLVRYTDDGAVTRTGIVRSTRVQDDAEARLTQTIQIEARA